MNPCAGISTEEESIGCTAASCQIGFIREIPGMSVRVSQLAWVGIAPLQAWNRGTRINANFGRIQPLAFTVPSAIHNQSSLTRPGRVTRRAARLDSLSIRAIRVPTALGHPGRRVPPTDADRIAIPKLPDEPKFGMVPPSTGDRLLVSGAR